MKKYLFYIILPFFLACNVPNDDKGLQLMGIKEPVEIIRDQWGINHIYAKNQQDLFFAQGYAAAKDRLFQFEIWRRQSTGTVAEILGERELKRDIGTRLFKFRGDLDEEFSHYHKDGIEIINSYTAGVNAYIEEILKTPEDLPIEFKMLGIAPEKWTPEVVISRHQGLLGNINEELQLGREVAMFGEDFVRKMYWFHPKSPDLTLDPSITSELLEQDILGLYNAYRKKVSFEKEDILPPYRSNEEAMSLISSIFFKEDSLSIGSNNWVVSGSRTASGNAVMANDPHRTIANPSLRYMTHLVAPGWNVVGGGEPEIPGISIGHNEYGAWGLTVFETDGEDLYVYDINPENHNQYRFKGEWKDFEMINETIPVKDKAEANVELRYSIHGPVTLIDTLNNKAFAVRCAWLEPGGAPYLASLRMNQAKNWDEFREACNASNIPGENMIWADVNGDIGWQAVGIAPVRKQHSGLVPVPGNGDFEWEGYLPIVEKPNSVNPESGFIATANQNVTPENYTNWDAIGYSWADGFRGERIFRVLSENKKFTMNDFIALQTDYYSIPAEKLIPMLLEIEMEGKAKEAQDKLRKWNLVMNKQSVEATIYNAWERQIHKMAGAFFFANQSRDYDLSFQLTTLIEWLEDPNDKVWPKGPGDKDNFIRFTFEQALADVTAMGGEDMNDWIYGSTTFKHSKMDHPLGNVVNDSLQNVLNIGPLPRGGNGYTVGSTGGNYRQSSGASFRVIIEVGDWEKSVGMNSPGQSGNPSSKYYSNLFEMWANDTYFPLYYSREVVEKNAEESLMFNPMN